jgi:hypothetical protein
MASTSYDDGSEPLGRSAATPRERSVGEHIFIWIAWALAAAFWGATMTTFVGILRAAFQSGPGVVGGADAAGVTFTLMEVAGGLIVLGLAIAVGSWMFAHRNRALDPMTEAATARLYDHPERPDREDLSARPADRGL